VKSKCLYALLFVVATVLVVRISGGDQGREAASRIERGQYLVEHVGMCGDCHTPKTDKGEYDRTQWLQGDVLSFKPTVPMPFAVVAPAIAGLPTLSNEVLAVRFFESGTNASGKLAMPPMPQFRLNHDDALSVVAYLRSLKK
jgi:mono/diheme cytochrome c family protein